MLKRAPSLARVRSLARECAGLPEAELAEAGIAGDSERRARLSMCCGSFTSTDRRPRKLLGVKATRVRELEITNIRAKGSSGANAQDVFD